MYSNIVQQPLYLRIYSNMQGYMWVCGQIDISKGQFSRSVERETFSSIQLAM